MTKRKRYHIGFVLLNRDIMDSSPNHPPSLVLSTMVDVQDIDCRVSDCKKNSVHIFRFSMKQLADFFWENFMLTALS
jgi:hypothetical protein